MQQATGERLLRSISADNAELEQLLGAEYNNIVSVLGGHLKSASQTGAPAATGSRAARLSGSTASAVAGRGPVVSNAAGRAAPVIHPPPPPRAYYPAPAPSVAYHPAHSAAMLPGQAGTGPSATAASSQQVQLPPNAVATLIRTLKRGVPSTAAPNATAGSSATTGAVGGAPPAKKRKM